MTCLKYWGNVLRTAAVQGGCVVEKVEVERHRVGIWRKRLREIGVEQGGLGWCGIKKAVLR